MIPSIKRIATLLYARNLEFLRDRSTMGWNLILPVLLVFGLAFMFSGEAKPLFKVAVVTDQPIEQPLNKTLHPLLSTEHIEFYRVLEPEPIIQKVGRHQIDMLLDLRPQHERYWINSTSANGYMVERLLLANNQPVLIKQKAEGQQIRYVDWVVPGILGMNVMFSCLFGVGYVIVRYRKSGYLKRLNATPLTASEFLVAQILSRLILVVVITSAVFLGTHLIMHFVMLGSYWNLLLVLIAGTFSLIALGLIVAARVQSEEVAGGLLNFLTWPMMLVSGVWFSLEGANPWIQSLANLSPLTHMLSAARAVMLDGAGLADISNHLLILIGMGLVFVAIGTKLFKWKTE